MIKTALTGLLLCFVTAQADAADNPLSVHVLNTQNGLPSSGVTVVLEKRKDDDWVELNSAKTDQQGRISALYPQDRKLEEGAYKVTFETGDWFEEQGIDTFFPEIPVVFGVDGELDHYHIPLLLSPFGYSTYRGN